MKQTLLAIQQKLEQTEKLGIYVELESFTGISSEALVEDLKFALVNLERFTKKAVVSDEAWVRVLMEKAGGLVPSVAVRLFPSSEKQAALDWVNA